MAAVREEFLDFFAAIADDIQKDAAQHELPQHSMDWIQKVWYLKLIFVIHILVP